jgi:hypothetical protein
MKTSKSAEPAVTYAFVGNLGCIRFPPEIRKASGIKRGDRLSVGIKGSRGIILDKFDVPAGVATKSLSVSGCSCQQAPEGCSRGAQDVVTVGWSYVKLDPSLANELGFVPDAPVKLVGERSRITVSLHRRMQDLDGIAKLPCPP